MIHPWTDIEEIKRLINKGISAARRNLPYALNNVDLIILRDWHRRLKVLVNFIEEELTRRELEGK